MKNHLFFTFVFLLLFSMCERKTLDLKSHTPEEMVEEILFGGSKTCVKENECLSGICSYNLCMGFLITPNLFQQDKGFLKIKKIVKNNPEIENLLLKNIEEIFNDELKDVVIRARAIYLMIRINKEFAKKYYEKYLDTGEEILRFRIALALCEENDFEGEKIISQFKNHSSSAVRELFAICKKNTNI